MYKKGFTLVEVIVCIIILALTMTALANVFIAGRRHIIGTRMQMTAGELGRFFLDHLNMEVRQDQWNSNCVGSWTSCPGAQTIDNINYAPTYTVNAVAGTDLKRVSVTIRWTIVD